MKSIRRSLTLYFLAVLLVSLGAVSLFVHYRTGETLRREEMAKEQLIWTKYRAEEKSRKAQLDKDLLAQARSLASIVRFHYDHRSVFGKTYSPYKTSTIAAMLGAGANVNSHFGVPIAYLQGSARPVMHLFYRHTTSRPQMKIRLDNNNPITPIHAGTEEFFQVNSAWGSTYSSPNMEGRTFAFDSAVLEEEPVLGWQFETVRLGSTKVRLVKLTVPSTRWGSGPRRNYRGPGRGSRNRSSERSRPALYIQYGCDTKRLDLNLTRLKAGRDKSLVALRSETLAEHQSVRNYLILVLSGTFALAIVGCFWMVRLGLAPLRRLSEAVSRISERDFRLQFDGQHVPGEVTPIVERLKKSLEQLSLAFSREKQATADISHDLRTPVAALLTTIDFTLRKDRSAAEYRDALEECRLSGQQMNQIVERLLSLARLDAGVAQVSPQMVNVTEVVSQSVALVRPLAEERGLQLRMSNGSTQIVRTDADKLREIVNNLLHNAVQYNQPNGSIEVQVIDENGQIKVRVSDTGIGISPEHQMHIFERFYRADASRYTDDLNAGLGLAIAKGYVDLLGGTLNVESEEGRGSTFNIYLPA